MLPLQLVLHVSGPFHSPLYSLLILRGLCGGQVNMYTGSESIEKSRTQLSSTHGGIYGAAQGGEID